VEATEDSVTVAEAGALTGAGAGAGADILSLGFALRNFLILLGSDGPRPEIGRVGGGNM
jgi:hypothetical protein